ncbi:MAG: ankyrin repeat domain-containing protein, partial [Tepidanaerobacteraceae bacterium]
MGKSNSKSSQPIIFQKIKEMNIDSSFKEILTNDIDLDERNNKGQTPLIYAAQIGNLQAVKMLID